MFALLRMRFFALALMIAVLQAGLPVLAYAKMAQENGLTQEICSPSGVKKIVIGADGSVQEAAPDSGHGEHCQLCATGGMTPVSTLIQMHESARNAGAIRVGQTCYQAGSVITTPPATGPPSRS